VPVELLVSKVLHQRLAQPVDDDLAYWGSGR
jgi:hypothetical protein